ncbi:uncharacterized protein LOC134834553 [Culicoides brevitarsis]|uniref:uncharacterized protein LOC134834553 n=1 Tax=Culicoides brevitarsis TaxID=469753 RepID=UPI00307B8948
MHHLHHQCFSCTNILRFSSAGTMYSFYQKVLLTFTAVVLILSSNEHSIAHGQDLFGKRDYGLERNSADANGEAIATNSLSSLSPNEPSCEELRMMWRFSKRQSRSSEISNELPTYRDPFAYNIWKPYNPSTRSFEGRQRSSNKYRDPGAALSTRPVYGRVVNHQPLGRLQEYPDRGRTMDRFYVPEYKTSPEQPSRYRMTSNRMAGGGGGVILPPARNTITPQRGSFGRLKELVWTERARELQAQRKAEEIAARMAVLKNIANGQSTAFQAIDF